MKIALVHDYIKEFGGAERVLRVLAEMYPEAPIYTAFRVDGSSCDKEFQDRVIIESKWGWLIKRGKLYSPLRFLLPWIWKSLDLSQYDLVLTSCSSYIARGFKVGDKTKVIAYCHTPPKFLYGFQTSINWQKYWPVKVYGIVVNHFLRLFDWEAAQRVDVWVVNSENVRERVKKFYKRDSVVIYPPIDVERFIKKAEEIEKKENYFLIVSRLVGGKGIEEAAEAAVKLGFKLKIAGEISGWAQVGKNLKKYQEGGQIEVLGRVNEEELVELYVKAKGFIALAREEDFGVTVVEAMASGTPVIGFNGGGFRETIIDGVTGVLIDGTSKEDIEKGIERFGETRWKKEDLQKQAKKFERERFEVALKKMIEKVT